LFPNTPAIKEKIHFGKNFPPQNNQSFSLGEEGAMWNAEVR
jgi:hypothetical protein